MAAYALTITYYYERNLTAVAILTGYQLCGAGVAGVLIVPTARVWGKRHLYILGNILMIASTAWAGASGHNYESLLWSRVIQGVALAPFEALVNASVGDLYFVHVSFSHWIWYWMIADNDRNVVKGWLFPTSLCSVAVS